MEDSDTISRDALKRLSYLESRVRQFRIASSGAFTVSGGFGKLPFSDDPYERLANLEKSFSEFKLESDGLLVQGGIDTGYTISA